ncbi:hypothetical protein MBLNU459_g8272t1 [Dothideomycetes sp. NU459]
MSSYVKDAISRVRNGGAASSEGEDDKDSGNPLNYLLQVTAGPTYETSTKHQVVINGPPCVVDATCKLSVRIQEYRGLPRDAPDHSPYFDDPSRKKDTFSLAFLWVPKNDVQAEDLVWGNELLHPIRDRIPKRFINTAFKIVKEFIDPSLRCDPYADEPWLNGPIICSTAITFSIGSSSDTSAASPSAVLFEGGDGDGAAIRKQLKIPDADNGRRKYFASEARRSEFIFQKGRAYQFDFHHGYIDWKNYALKLPGFSLGVLRYINNQTHTLRFVMKNRKTGEAYLVVSFKLLFGDELEQALAEDEASSGGAAGRAGAAVNASAVDTGRSEQEATFTEEGPSVEEKVAPEERNLPQRSSNSAAPNAELDAPTQVRQPDQDVGSESAASRPESDTFELDRQPRQNGTLEPAISQLEADGLKSDTQPDHHMYPDQATSRQEPDSFTSDVHPEWNRSPVPAAAAEEEAPANTTEAANPRFEAQGAEISQPGNVPETSIQDSLRQTSTADLSHQETGMFS